MMDFYMVKEIISDYINVVVEKTFVITVISSIFVRNVNARYEYIPSVYTCRSMCIVIYTSLH